MRRDAGKTSFDYFCPFRIRSIRGGRCGCLDRLVRSVTGAKLYLSFQRAVKKRARPDSVRRELKKFRGIEAILEQPAQGLQEAEKGGALVLREQEPSFLIWA